MPFCQSILTVPGLAQGPVFQVAIEELFHPPGTFHGEHVGAAIDVDVRPGEAHAAAFHVGRLAFDRDLGLRRVGLRGVQPLAGDQQRQIAGQGRLRLLQFHVVDDRDLGQVAMLLVLQEHAGLQQAAADFHVGLPAAGRCRILCCQRRGGDAGATPEAERGPSASMARTARASRRPRAPPAAAAARRRGVVNQTSKRCTLVENCGEVAHDVPFGQQSIGLEALAPAPRRPLSRGRGEFCGDSCSQK